MPTNVTSGTTQNIGLLPGQTVTITAPPNCEGVITELLNDPSGTSNTSDPQRRLQGRSIPFGPVPFSKSFGPYDLGATLQVRVTANGPAVISDVGSFAPASAVGNIAIIGNSIVAQNLPAQAVYGGNNWLPNSAVTVNSGVYPQYWNLTNGVAGIKWVCTQGGTTGTLEPDWPHNAQPGTTVTDGTVVWTAVDLAGTNGGLGWYWGFGHWNIANALAGQRLNEAVIMGRSGKLSAEILSYVPRILANPNIGTVFLANVFENDCWPSGAAPNLATIQTAWANFVSVADQIRATGRRLMVQTLFPSGNIDSSGSPFTGYTFGNGSRAWIWLNNQIRAYARARPDVVIWDAANVYTDTTPANPVWPENAITYTSAAASGQALKKTDGIHPYKSGQIIMGLSLANVLRANFPERAVFTMALDPNNYTANPLNGGTSGSVNNISGSPAQAPNGMSVSAFGGTAASCTLQNIARTDNGGNWSQMVYSATVGDNANWNWTSNSASPAVGSVVQAFGELQIVSPSAAFVAPQMMLRFIGAQNQWSQSNLSASVDQDFANLFPANTVLTLKTVPTVVPSGTTNLNLFMKAFTRGSGAITVSKGRDSVMLVNQNALAP